MPNTRKPTDKQLAEWLAEAEAAVAAGRPADLDEDQRAELAKLSATKTKKLRPKHGV